MKCYRLALPLALAAVALLVVVGCIAKTAPVEVSPQAVGPNVQTLILARGMTQTTTGTALAANLYNTANCYLIASGWFTTTPQTVTLNVQHSLDGVNYFDLLSWTLATNTLSFTTSSVYGNWLRADATPITSSVAVNLNLQCQMK